VSPEVLAALLGVLGGVLIERVARSWGRLWCEPSDWRLDFFASVKGGGETSNIPPSEAYRAAYSVRLDFYNGKEIPVGLRNARIEIYHGAGGGVLISNPLDMGAPTSPDRLRDVGKTHGELSLVNLPPRQWVPIELRWSYHQKEDVRRLAWWYRVEFVGERQRRGLFEPKTFRKTIASRSPYPDPFR